MSKEFERLSREPDKNRRNYKITKRCQTCENCVVDHAGKHIISFECKLDGKFVGLTGICDEWREKNE